MKSNQELVSIIIPIYNVKPYLQMCMDSVLRQSYSNLEIILVNDGSTDGSEEIAERYIERDKRVSLIHQVNMGLSAARNTGIRKSTGKYIYLLDSDDMLHPQAIESMVYLMQKECGDIVIGNFKYIEEEENPLQSIPIDLSRIEDLNTKRVLTGKDFLLETGNLLNVVAWGKLYKRETFDLIEYPVGRLHEDRYVTYKILYPLTKVVVIEEQHYYYRKRNNSITSQKNMERRIRDTLAAYEEAIEFYGEKSDYILWAYSLKNKINCLRQLVDNASNEQEKIQNIEILNKEYDVIQKCYRNKINKHITSIKEKIAFSLFFTDYRMHDWIWGLLMRLMGEK